MNKTVTNPPNFRVPETRPLPDDGAQAADPPPRTPPAADAGPGVLRKGHENPP